MENEKTQKELFEFEAPKKTTPRFGEFLQKTDFVISLTIERLVFVAIGIIMLLVAFFALGVERGKSVAANTAPIIAASAPIADAKAAPALIVQKKVAVPSTNITVKDRNASGAAQVKPAAAPAKTAVEVRNAQAQADKDKPYTIVAAAFLRQEFAAKEVTRLKGSGLEAFVYYSEPYYIACVGSFANKDSAQKILNKVRQMHRDAYVRLK